MDPIEVYQKATDFILPVAFGIGPDQAGLATPCTEWSVLQLVNHNIEIQAGAHALLARHGAEAPPADLNAELPEGAGAALQGVTGRVVEALESMDLEEPLDTPFGLIPASRFILFPMADLVIHKWDLAKATGQDCSIDHRLAEICYRVLAPVAEMARENGECGPEVAVPPSASVQYRLLGMAGRQPQGSRERQLR